MQVGPGDATPTPPDLEPVPLPIDFQSVGDQVVVAGATVFVVVASLYIAFKLTTRFIRRNHGV